MEAGLEMFDVKKILNYKHIDLIVLLITFMFAVFSCIMIANAESIDLPKQDVDPVAEDEFVRLDTTNNPGTDDNDVATGSRISNDDKTDLPNSGIGQQQSSVELKTSNNKPELDGSDDKKTQDKGLIAQSDIVAPKYEDTHINVYRVFNPFSGAHLFTPDQNEARKLSSLGWQWEGIGWVSPKSGTPIFRLYNPNNGEHHYTSNAKERDSLVKIGWRKEGVSWYSDTSDQKALYRLFNPKAKSGTHLVTSSKNEYDTLGKSGWRKEGVTGYVTNGANISIKGFWLVSRSWGSLERYWVDSSSNIAKNRLIAPSEGSGYYAYAKGNGAVVRGKFDNGKGYVYVADNDGRLAATNDGKDGWIVTKAYDGGWQRYYYIAANHAMKIGFFTVGNSKFYGCNGVGYVARGKYTKGNFVLLSDNEGILEPGNGWLVTSKYDGGLQRYYLTSVQGGFVGAKTGLFTVDKKQYYGKPGHGYVARNEYTYSGRWYRSNNDGVLTPSESPEADAMFRRAQGFSSPTNTLILVDTNGCNFGVFSGSKGNWRLVRFERCTTGAPSTPTIKGTYSTKYHLPNLSDWPNAKYCTNIVGGYFFHSVLGSTNELGKRLSHGCIRLNWPTAQYVQSLPYNSTVNLY